MSKLSDELNRANRHNWSGREIARRGGDVVHHSTISRWLSGGRGYPDEATVEVFSAVLGIPRTRIRALAGLPAGEEEPYAPPDIANRLDEQQREVLDLLIHVLAREKGGSQDVAKPAKKSVSRGRGDQPRQDRGLGAALNRRTRDAAKRTAEPEIESDESTEKGPQRDIG